MASIQTIEQQIISEYGKYVGFIKNNAVLCAWVCLITGALIGYIL